MPTSTPAQINTVVSIMMATNPKTMLDVGIGYGKWGCMAREYVEGYRNRRYLPTEWKLMIHGIEIFEKYRNPMWGCYDKIMVGDVVKLIEKPDWYIPDRGYDLVIMMDVLEHIPRQQALEVLTGISKISKRFLFSYANSDQKGVCENEHEDHISKWVPEDFQLIGAKLIAKDPSGILGIMMVG